MYNALKCNHISMLVIKKVLTIFAHVFSIAKLALYFVRNALVLPKFNEKSKSVVRFIVIVRENTLCSVYSPSTLDTEGLISKHNGIR